MSGLIRGDFGVIGDAKIEALEDIWNSNKRKQWLEFHKQGQRAKVPLCSYCQFWGVPTAGKSEKTSSDIDEKDVVAQF